MTMMTIAGNGKSVRVRYNRTLREFVCELTANGKRTPGADYYTDDAEDAIGTAQYMVNTPSVSKREG